MDITLPVIGIVEAEVENPARETDRPDRLSVLLSAPFLEKLDALEPGSRLLVAGWVDDSSPADAGRSAGGIPGGLVLRTARFVGRQGDRASIEGLDLPAGTLVVDLRAYHGALGPDKTGGRGRRERRYVIPAEVEAVLRERVCRSLVDGRLPCSAAHRIAEETKVYVGQVGQIAEELAVKVSRCQLGCFG